MSTPRAWFEAEKCKKDQDNEQNVVKIVAHLKLLVCQKNKQTNTRLASCHAQALHSQACEMLECVRSVVQEK